MSPIDYVWETVKYAGITDVDTQRAINILEDNDMRVLKGWTKDEREELEDAEVNGFHNAIGLIHEAIFGDAYKSEYIYNKYCNCTSNKEDNQLIKDIADYYTGDAKFPEQKYRLTLPDGNYLARGMSGECRWKFIYNDVRGCNFAATGSDNTFTMQEIEDIDAKLKAFAVPVEADDE